jgi:hypothetical protein
LLIYLEKLMDDVSVEKIYDIPDQVKKSFLLTEGLKEALQTAATHLKGTQRRCFMAKTAGAMGRGGQRMVER